MPEMENKFQGLPPLKRFRLMHQEHEHAVRASLCLPAKKRRESHDLSPRIPEPAVAVAICLPAKKRVWAIQPILTQNEPIPPFDLNVEYKPQLYKEEIDPKQENIPSLNVNQIAEATVYEKVGVEGEGAEGGVNQIVEDSNGKGKDEIEAEEEDDGIECAVCRSTDGDPSDPIVFCDGCDLMVHSTCYGSPLINGVPDGDWFCSRCLASNSPKIEKPTFSCCLCSVAGGAVKPTKDGRWAHIVCALFVPEVFFVDPEGREGIDCSRIPNRRWEQRCYLCGTRSGCAIDCSEPKCGLGFHVTCGLNKDLCIEFQEGRSKGGIVAGFCKDHTELWKKQQQTGKFKIVARDEDKH
ncbi:hypothetical protein NMG60_11036893 [Bertholletia excelsa]